MPLLAHRTSTAQAELNELEKMSVHLACLCGQEGCLTCRAKLAAEVFRGVTHTVYCGYIEDSRMILTPFTVVIVRIVA